MDRAAGEWTVDSGQWTVAALSGFTAPAGGADWR